jgi:hypothetical protein
MCDKCLEIDRKIEHCRRLQSTAPDHNVAERIAALIEKLRAEKVALHPEEDQKEWAAPV